MMKLLQDSAATTDDLGFAPMSRILVDVIRSTQPPFTIGIFGEWGSGKTTLMSLVQQGLEQEESEGTSDSGAALKAKTVWFNAWKYDGKEVIWNALIQAIFYRMKTDPEVVNKGDLLAQITQTAGNLARYAAKTATRLIPGGFVGPDDVDAVIDAFSPLSANDPQFAFINQFEATFDQLVKEYVGPDGRLIVFVDDLDRCLPENAIEVLEAIKLYLDRTNITFLIAAERAIIEEGIRLRYRDNERLSAKEYLEKIVQLPFMMRGLDTENALNLIIPYAKAAQYQGDEKMYQLILAGTGANPRRLKRFVNTYYVLSKISEEAGMKPSGDDIHRLALVLLIQTRAPEVYDGLVRAPGLLQEFRDITKAGSQEREMKLAGRTDLKKMYDDAALRQFLEAADKIDIGPAAMKRWVFLAKGNQPLSEEKIAGG